MIKGVIYGRVSTIKQDYERQVNELAEYGKCNKINILGTFTEKITGKTKAKDRPAYSEMIEFCESNKVKIILVSELSRLGRNAIDVQQTINDIVNVKGIDLYIHQQNLKAFDNTGKPNFVFKLITDILANLAAMENEQRTERIRSGIANAKAKGVQLGRRKGTIKDITKTKNYKKIVRELRSGTSTRKTAKICEVSPTTVQKIKTHIATLED